MVSRQDLKDMYRKHRLSEIAIIPARLWKKGVLKRSPSQMIRRKPQTLLDPSLPTAGQEYASGKENYEYT